ncbi:hypothetical protein H4S14_004009 [Agrobacterium vitis]|nr:hypothetical protein [Agrobacterium vitis]MBE1440237.1 hypothetical protein [Agrobacterium vitis]
MPKYLLGRASEELPVDGLPLAAIVALKQRLAQLVFQVADTAADRRFLYAECGSGLSVAVMLGRRREIVQMAKLHFQ